MDEFPPRLQALLTVSLILDGEEAVKLFEYLPPKEKEATLLRARSYLALHENNRRTALASRLKALRSEFLLRQITDVHPSHIALVLANEPAGIIRVILHHLPQDMATEIEQTLPESTAARLSACPKPPTLPVEMLEVIKQAFIRQFVFILPGDNPVTWLNTSRLRTLLREMSLQTIATAMRRIEKDELVRSLQRFPRNHSKEIIRRLKLLRDVTAEQVFAAEKALVWLTAQNLRNFSIVEDTGLMLLAGGLLEANELLRKFVIQKLSIEETGRFHEISERLPQADPEVVLLARTTMQSCLKSILQPRQGSDRTETTIIPREKSEATIVPPHKPSNP